MQSALYSCQVLVKPDFSRQIFEKKNTLKISWKSVQLKSRFSTRANRRTDMTKLRVALHNYANASENVNFYLRCLKTRHAGLSSVQNTTHMPCLTPTRKELLKSTWDYVHRKRGSVTARNIFISPSTLGHGLNSVRFAAKFFLPRWYLMLVYVG